MRKSVTSFIVIVSVAIYLFGCNNQSSADISSKIEIDSSINSCPKNVILFIGDGMGPEQVKAAGLYANGISGSLSFEQFPYSGTATTHSANNKVTDSAAAATAMAAGIKVKNGVISMAIPGDKKELPTILEYYKAHDRSVGLVTTVYVTHATPAGFGAQWESQPESKLLLGVCPPKWLRNYQRSISFS